MSDNFYTGTSKSSISKTHYWGCKSFHLLPKFASKNENILVGNGQCVSILFTIQVILEKYNHKFKEFTLVSKIHENIALVLHVKNKFELEGIINLRESCYKF